MKPRHFDAAATNVAQHKATNVAKYYAMTGAEYDATETAMCRRDDRRYFLAHWAK